MYQNKINIRKCKKKEAKAKKEVEIFLRYVENSGQFIVNLNKKEEA